MKRIKYLVALIALFLFPLTVSAANGKISVTGTSTAVVGNKVTVTVTLSSSTSIGSWQMLLNYDKSYLQLTSSTAEEKGTAMAASSATGTKSKKYTFTFKTLKTGSTKVSVGSYLAYAFEDFSPLNLSSSSKTISIITQEQLEASYSKDNNLKSLEVEGFELSPAFSKDVLEYTVVVPEDTKEIAINAKENDSKASVNGDGTFEVTPGTNSFEVVVKAQNGSEKTYKITVEVKDSNPINVTVEDTNYTVVKIKENLPVPTAYEETTIKINDFDIPAFYSDITGITLVGLKNTAGEVELFIYDENTNTYNVYNELIGNKMIIYPLKTDKEIASYIKTKISINDVEIPAFVYNESSSQAVIYGVNIESGEEGFYVYDKETKSFVLFNNEEVEDLNEKLELYTYIIFGFIGVVFLLFIIILVLCKKRKKRKKKELKKMEDIKEFTIKPKAVKEDKKEEKDS